MFLRVNGLFGWIQANDRRSIVLCLGFLAALNLAAVLVLYVPLLAFDPDHAPMQDWGGYARRYVPLVTLAALGFFLLNLLVHVRSVRRAVDFRFVDGAEEPRLCGLVEPLAIGMGLPAPYVGVIETGALNAFACGLSRRNAVVVVTRGLIDGLDDDELSAVLAHELAHIANGDIRLIAAANACLRMIAWMVMPRLKDFGRFRQLLAFPAILLVMPPLLPFALIVSVCAQTVMRGSRLIRLLVSASREFIADARAAEVTQNPAALVSALRRIEGRSRLAALPPGQAAMTDAMMIDGDCDGVFATHPTIARRIEAITAVTGSMALIAPSRRDTRPVRTHVWAGAHGSPVPTDRSSASGDGVRDERNWLGLTPAMTVGLVLGLAVFAALHWRDWREPGKLAALVDPRPSGQFFAAVGRLTLCSGATLGAELLNLPAPTPCEDVDLANYIATQQAMAGPYGARLSSAWEQTVTGPVEPIHLLSNRPSPQAEAVEVVTRRCFRTQGYSRNRTLYAVDKPPRPDGSYDLRRWLRHSESLAAQAGATDADDAGLRAYVEARKQRYESVDRLFGDPGLALMQASFAGPDHRSAVERLRRRLADPGWAESLSPVERAEFTLLTQSPDEFMPCIARHRMDQRPG